MRVYMVGIMKRVCFWFSEGLYNDDGILCEPSCNKHVICEFVGKQNMCPDFISRQEEWRRNGIKC